MARRRLCLWGAVGCLSLGAIAGAAQAVSASGPPCAPDDGDRAAVRSVEEDLSLRLADGRLLRVAGVEALRDTPTHPGARAAAHEQLARWLVGLTVSLRPTEAVPDRWGRLPALVFAPSAEPVGASLSVAAAMVDAGLARVAPEAGTQACGPALRAAEDGARKAGLGLWGDPYYAVRQAADGPSLTDALGSMVIVEGRVTHVGETRARVYLDFGPGRGAFAVRIAKRNSFILDQRGLGQNHGIGRLIRVRGVLDERNGPQIDVVDPDQIEVIDLSSPQTAAP